MEKNCTNCKYHLPISGNCYSGRYSGFCNHTEHVGRLANKHSVCSEYEIQEKSMCTDEELQNVLLGIKCCTDSESKGCSECPFARYKCTCQQDLMFAAGAAIEKLQRELGGYIVDQGIWLARNDYLESENKSLWDSYHKGYAVGYAYGKQDALSADRSESCAAPETINSEDRLV